MSDEFENWVVWRDQERHKHRYMTYAEYRGWCRAGDSISDPTSTNAFPGGITIDFGAPRIIGRTSP